MKTRNPSGAAARETSAAGSGPVPSTVTSSAKNASSPVRPLTSTTSPGERGSEVSIRRLPPASCTITASSAQTTVPRKVTPGVSAGNSITSGMVSTVISSSKSIGISPSSGKSSASAAACAGHTAIHKMAESRKHANRFFTQMTTIRHFSTSITRFSAADKPFCKKMCLSAFLSYIVL